MLRSEKDILRLIDALYSCAEGASPWSVFLDSLAEAAGASVVSLTVHQLNGRGSGVESYVGADPGEFRNYVQHYARLNPWFSGASRFPEGTILSTDEVLPVQALRKTAFYNEWGKKNHVTHALGGAITIQGDTMCFLAVNRGDSHPSFEETERQLLQSLMPHLRRAVSLHNRLAFLAEQQWVLGALSFPLIHVASDGTILWTNVVGERFLREGHGLFIRGGKLHAEFPEQDSRLRGMLGADRRIIIGSSVGYGGWLRINRGDDDSALSLFLVRAPCGVRPLAATLRSSDGFLIFVAAQSMNPEVLEGRLRDIWKLTSAESALVSELLDSDNLQVAADRLQISRNTAKTQLASVFQKAGVRKQSELVRELVALAVVGEPGSLLG